MGRGEGERRLVGDDDAAAGVIAIEVCQLKSLVPERLLHFVAETVVEGQLCTVFPVILNEDGIVIGRAVDVGTGVGEAGALRRAEEEVGKSVSRPHTVEAVFAEVVAGEEGDIVGGPEDLPIGASFDGVPTFVPRKVICELDVTTKLGVTAAFASSREAGDAEVRDAGDGRGSGADALNADGLGDGGAIEAGAIGTEVIAEGPVGEAGAELIHEVCLDYIVISDGETAGLGDVTAIAECGQAKRRGLNDVF